MKLEGLKINFLGDSITEGVGVADPANTFHQRLKRTAGLAEARNYGVGGTRIAPQHSKSDIEQWDLDFLMRADAMDPDADMIVVFGGTNDYGHGDAPIGSIDDRTSYSFYGALHVLIRKLYDMYPGKTIIFMTPVHRLNESSPRGDGYKAPTLPLSGYVDVIKDVCRYYAIPVLDLFAVSSMQPDVESQMRLFMPDGLHPNDAGHAIIASRLEGFLRGL